MGAFFTNCHVRTKDAANCQEALAGVIGLRAFMTDSKNGWITVYDEESESQDINILQQLAQNLSSKLKTVAVAMLVHDSDVLQYVFYEKGKLIDQFDSKPDYFGPVADAQKREWYGDFAKLLPYTPIGITLTDFERTATEKLVFEEERAAQFAELLGIDPERAKTGFKYTQRTQQSFKLIHGTRSSPHKAELIEAVSRRDAGRVRALLEQGAPANAHDQCRVPLLVNACRYGNLEILRDLLSHGADLFAEGPGGGDALWLASAEGHEAVVDYLLEKGKGSAKLSASLRVAFGAAVTSGYAGITQKLIAAGANAKEKTALGQPPLLLACMRGHERIWEARTGRPFPPPRLGDPKKDWKQVILILLEAGAEVPFPTKDGPIDVKTLSVEQRSKLADALLDAGSKIKLPGKLNC